MRKLRSGAKALESAVRDDRTPERIEEDLMAERWFGLMEACRKSHSGVAGGAAMCICGAGGGGSRACSMLAILRDFVRYVPKDKLSKEWQEQADKILRACEG
jgi:hypothetical protein